MNVLTASDRAIIMYAMARNNPVAFNAAIQRMKAPGLNGFGETDTQIAATATTNPDWFDRLMQFAQAAGAYITSRDLAKINLERAKKGLEPISADSIAPQVQVGLSPETRGLIKFALIGLGLLLLLKIVRK